MSIVVQIYIRHQVRRSFSGKVALSCQEQCPEIEDGVTTMN